MNRTQRTGLAFLLFFMPNIVGIVSHFGFDPPSNSVLFLIFCVAMSCVGALSLISGKD